jgi:hypothetical protein
MDAIVFDHATCLTGVPDDEVIAKSSSFSFLDKNGNSSYDEGEKKGPFVVVASTQLDEGKLIVISDPSIIINGMLDMENNYTLMENAAEGKQIFLDQSHLPQSMLSRVKEDLGLARGALSHPGVVFGVAGAILALTWRGVWRGSKRR